MLGGPMHQMRQMREEKAQDVSETLQRLWIYFLPYKRSLIGIGLLLVIDMLCQMAAPYLIGVAIDQFITTSDRAGLARIMVVLFLTFIIGWLTRYGEFTWMIRIGNQVLYSIRSDIFQRIQSLSLSYFDRHKAGDLMSRLTNDVDTIGQVLNFGLMQTLSSSLLIIGILIAMFSLNWQLALATFIILPFMFLSSVYLSGRARRAFRQTRQTIGSVSADLEENISGIRVAQAFARSDENIERFSQLNRANRDANVAAQGITAAFMPTLDVLSTVGLAIVLGVGGYLALQDPPLISVGIIVAFMVYVRRFFQPVQQLANLYAQLQSAIAGSERIFELLDTKPEIFDSPDAGELPQVKGKVVFENVSFRYNPDEPVLKNIDVIVEPGQTIALVGPTGAGKTTFVNLIGRFYDPNEGVIKVDDHDIREVTNLSLRSQLGIVLQDTFLFSDTIMENIRYGQLSASDEDVIKSATLANANDFIQQLPDGYSTILSEQGRNLSQGQRQLIAIARALLANPRLLILDEATSSVDTRTELLIQQALKFLLQNRTSFVIAHRLSTIRNADQVLVMKEGEIVEKASSTPTKSAHQILLESGGEYSRLYASQFRQNNYFVK